MSLTVKTILYQSSKNPEKREHILKSIIKGIINH